MSFTAYADASRYYGEHQPVLFNRVLSQFGNAYNPVSSTFTCPVTGVYVISVTVTSIIGDRMRCQIMWESSVYLSAYGDNDGSTYNSASATQIIECAAGERIWIRSNGSSGNTMYGDGSAFRLSSFCGFLLHAY